MSCNQVKDLLLRFFVFLSQIIAHLLQTLYTLLNISLRIYFVCNLIASLIIVMIVETIKKHSFHLILMFIANVELSNGIVLIESWVQPFVIVIPQGDLACMANSFRNVSCSLDCPDKWRAFNDYLIEFVLLDIIPKVLTSLLNLLYAERGQRRVTLHIIVDICLGS